MIFFKNCKVRVYYLSNINSIHSLNMFCFIIIVRATFHYFKSQLRYYLNYYTYKHYYEVLAENMQQSKWKSMISVIGNNDFTSKWKEMNLVIMILQNDRCFIIEEIKPLVWGFPRSFILMCLLLVRLERKQKFVLHWNKKKRVFMTLWESTLSWPSFK